MNRKSVLYRVLNRRGIIYFLLFNAYLIFIHPSLLSRLADVSQDNPAPLIGWIFLLLPLLELVGFWLKYPLLRHYAEQYPERQGNSTIMLIVLLPVFHLGMSAFLFIIGSQIAGIQPSNDAAWYWQVLFGAGFFIMLFKEGGFLLLFLSFGGIPWTGRQQYPPDVPILRRLRKKIRNIQLTHILEDSLGDLLLLGFSTLGYTAVWEYTAMTSPFYTRVGPWDFFLQLIGVLIYLLMVIPPLHAVYLIQDTLVRTRKAQKLWSWGQYLLTFVFAFLSITKG